MVVQTLQLSLSLYHVRVPVSVKTKLAGCADDNVIFS